MSDNPKWGTETVKQAEYLEDFKKTAAADLAAIKSRLVWLLMPSFIITLAVLGLSVFTWISVNELQQEVSRLKTIEKTVEDVNHNVKFGH